MEEDPDIAYNDIASIRARERSLEWEYVSIRLEVTEAEMALLESIVRARYAPTLGEAFRLHQMRESMTMARLGRAPPILIVGSGPLFPPLMTHIHTQLTPGEREQLRVLDLQYENPAADARMPRSALTERTQIYVNYPAIPLELSIGLREEIAACRAVLFIGDDGSLPHRVTEREVKKIAKSVDKQAVSILYTTWLTELPAWDFVFHDADHGVRLYLEDPLPKRVKETSPVTLGALAIVRGILGSLTPHRALPFWLTEKPAPWLVTTGLSKNGECGVALRRALKGTPASSEQVLLLPASASRPERPFDEFTGELPPGRIIRYPSYDARRALSVVLTRLEAEDGHVQ